MTKRNKQNPHFQTNEFIRVIKISHQKMEMCPHVEIKCQVAICTTSCCDLMIWIAKNIQFTHPLWRLEPPIWGHATMSNIALNKMHINYKFLYQIFKSALILQVPAILFFFLFHLCLRIGKIGGGCMCMNIQVFMLSEVLVTEFDWWVMTKKTTNKTLAKPCQDKYLIRW